MLMQAAGRAGRRPSRHDRPGRPGLRDRIWVPSASGAARFRRLRSAFGIGTARSFDRIDHAIALRELVHAGLMHRSRDVDDEHHGWARRRRPLLRGAGPRLGDRHRLGQRARVPEPRAAEHRHQHDDQSRDLPARERVQTFPERHVRDARRTPPRRSENRHIRTLRTRETAPSSLHEQRAVLAVEVLAGRKEQGLGKRLLPGTGCRPDADLICAVRTSRRQGKGVSTNTTSNMR